MTLGDGMVHMFSILLRRSFLPLRGGGNGVAKKLGFSSFGLVLVWFFVSLDGHDITEKYRVRDCDATQTINRRDRCRYWPWRGMGHPNTAQAATV